MKYNSKYDRYVTKGGLVYRYSKRQDKLILCKLSTNRYGYSVVGISKPKRKLIFVHRMVYEAFVGEIPQGYEIDHINTIRDDNSVENLRLVTHKENVNNPLTKQRHKGNTSARGKTFSEFGNKFKEHYGISNYENHKLYDKELHWYFKHNKVCRWESKKGFICVQ